LGAKVIVTPAAMRAVGMVKIAQDLAKKNGWFLARQFENPANPDIHERTTAQEILRDFEGEPLDYWVTGYGTGGTLTGVGRVLRAKRPETKIVVCEPADAALLASGEEQARNPDGSPAAGHPAWKPHPMQGWTPDFIPLITGEAAERHLYDELMTIAGPEAIATSQRLATQEGIFVGITSGATFAGALKIAERAKPGANILAMLPDTGERYLSTPLFADVPAEMTAEEVAIARQSQFYVEPQPA
jgi:cysteine synthase A